jgi:hypothetical protein
VATWLGWTWLVFGALVALVGWAGGSGRLTKQSWPGSQWIVGGGALVATTGLLMLVFTPDDDTAAVMSIVLVPTLAICLITAAVLAAQKAQKAQKATKR